MTTETEDLQTPADPDEPAGDQPFKPGRHLRGMRGGSKYLDVKWRVAWANDTADRGDLSLEISTELIKHDRQVGEYTDSKGKKQTGVLPTSYAEFKAVAELFTYGLDGRVTVKRGVGHGSEESGDFSDYYEKAETKAVGRALDKIGFGTQFTENDDEALADSPVKIDVPDDF